MDRGEIPLGTRLYRHTDAALQASLNLNYTILDFGARGGRIDADRARVLAADSGFNDVHRRLVFQVRQAYYRLLNASAGHRRQSETADETGGSAEAEPAGE